MTRGMFADHVTPNLGPTRAPTSGREPMEANGMGRVIPANGIRFVRLVP